MNTENNDNDNDDDDDEIPPNRVFTAGVFLPELSLKGTFNHFSLSFEYALSSVH